jgi:hypothetical protein
MQKTSATRQPLFQHCDATVDMSWFKTVKAMFPQTARVYAGPKSASPDNEYMRPAAITSRGAIKRGTQGK